jgi:hypothetical protein
MKEILAVLGTVTIVVIWFSLVPMLGDTLDGSPLAASGTLSFVGGTVADGDTVTIASTTLEFDLAGNGVAGGNIDVDIADSSPDTASTALANAINNDVTLSALVTAVRSP